MLINNVTHQREALTTLKSSTKWTLLVHSFMIYQKDNAITKVEHLEGNCTPNQKLACFVLYLKIINTFLKNLKADCPRNSKIALKF